MPFPSPSTRTPGIPPPRHPAPPPSRLAELESLGQKGTWHLFGRSLNVTNLGKELPSKDGLLLIELASRAGGNYLGIGDVFSVPVRVAAGEVRVVDLRLQTATLLLEEIRVEAIGAANRERARFDTEAGVTARVIQGETLKFLPGLAEADVLRAVETYLRHAYPDGNVLFDYAQDEKFAVFGTSAKFIDSVRKAGLRPLDSHDLTSVRTISSTGSPLAPAAVNPPR